MAWFSQMLYEILKLKEMHETNTMKNHGPTIKNDKQYEALRDKGMSKEKAAWIANTPDSGKKGGEATRYEERTLEELYQQARKIGIDGRSKMNKKELINALRNH